MGLSSAALVGALSHTPILDVKQREELRKLAAEFRDGPNLLEELVRRGQVPVCPRRVGQAVRRLDVAGLALELEGRVTDVEVLGQPRLEPLAHHSSRLQGRVPAHQDMRTHGADI